MLQPADSTPSACVGLPGEGQCDSTDAGKRDESAGQVHSGGSNGEMCREYYVASGYMEAFLGCLEHLEDLGAESSETMVMRRQVHALCAQLNRAAERKGGLPPDSARL